MWPRLFPLTGVAACILTFAPPIRPRHLDEATPAARTQPSVQAAHRARGCRDRIGSRDHRRRSGRRTGSSSNGYCRRTRVRDSKGERRRQERGSLRERVGASWASPDPASTASGRSPQPMRQQRGPVVNSQWTAGSRLVEQGASRGGERRGIACAGSGRVSSRPPNPKLHRWPHGGGRGEKGLFLKQPHAK
jgi:hypothetical protein